MDTGLSGTDGAGDASLGRIRVAAVGDVHVGKDTGRKLPSEVEHIAERADLLVLAGDLTQHGAPEEGELVASALARLRLPIIAVLGNHDYHLGAEGVIRSHLEHAGVRVLEGESHTVVVRGRRIGIAGVKGFGGGFPGACGSEFGESEMKAFMRHSRECAERLEEQLAGLDCEVKVAVTHYAPVPDTLEGERREIYPFLGSYYLGEAIDKTKCNLAVHGHAHRGTERGMTPGGVPVRNVARPVIALAYKVYFVGEREAPVESMRLTL